MNDLEHAKQILHSSAYTFVVVKDGRELAHGARDGIGELLELVHCEGERLRGASLADKIVGKAVAMVAVYAGITGIYTPLGSDAARRVLDQYGIPFQSERTVPLIRNKRDDGPCPLERLTEPLSEPAAAVTALDEFVAQRRALVA
jgi:hypothetical protein